MTIDFKKIMAVIGIDLVAITLLYCIFGFIFGGKPDIFTNIPYTIFSIITVIGISLFTFFFIKKRVVGEKLPPYLLAGIMFLVSFVSYGIYNFENEILSSEEPIRYEAVVEDIKSERGGSGGSHYAIWFKNANGDLVSVTNDYDSPKVGAIVQVEEIPGAFGYSEYYIAFEIVE